MFDHLSERVNKTLLVILIMIVFLSVFGWTILATAGLPAELWEQGNASVLTCATCLLSGALLFAFTYLLATLLSEKK